MTAAPRPRAVHYAWIVAAVTFVTLLVAAAIRATPINLVLYGLIGPFGAAGAMCLTAAAEV